MSLLLTLLINSALIGTLWFFVGRLYERITARYAARIRELEELQAALEDEQ